MHLAGLGSIFGAVRQAAQTLHSVRAICIRRGSTPCHEPNTKEILAGLFLRVIIEPSRYGPRHYMKDWIVGSWVVRDGDVLPPERG